MEWIVTIFRIVMSAVVPFVFAAALATAQAQDAAIERAKTDRVIGESYTGYLAVVDPSRMSPDLKRRLEQINAGRLAAYTRAAERTEQSVAVIAALSAEKQISRAGPGEAVLPGDGESWTIKP
jgi:uncharacterized protein YdbL (DUF1318 family)